MAEVTKPYASSVTAESAAAQRTADIATYARRVTEAAQGYNRT
jgi:hypothetical protein